MIGFAVVVAGYIAVVAWVVTTERQIKKMRLDFFRSLLRQDIGWFDGQQTGELNNRLTA